MRPANAAARRIADLIEAFERSVAAAEDALVIRDWQRVDACLDDQARLRHELANVLAETAAERPEHFSAEVQRRLNAIVVRRDDQLRRLVAFRHLVGERLALLAQSRDLRRTIVRGSNAAMIDRFQ